MVWRFGRSDTTSDGLDRCNRPDRTRRFDNGGRSIRLAVPSFQCFVMEPSCRLRQSRIPNDGISLLYYLFQSVADEKLNARVALRHSVALIPVCVAAWYSGLTTGLFVVDSMLVNVCLIVPAWYFWRKSDERTARRLFFASLIHLPVLLGLFMVHKSVEANGIEEDVNNN